MGLGVSGLWTTRYLLRRGASVTVSDHFVGKDLDPQKVKEIKASGAALETGGHRPNTMLGADLIIVSPGVPHETAVLGMAREKGIPVVGELEFSGRLVDAPMIAVTGTNGKSTVTQLLGLLFENAGLKTFVGGNIGTPLVAYLEKGKKADYIIVEVSSFQLDTIESFCPFISVILNISPDHLDRYPGYDDYIQSKFRIFSNQKKGDYTVFNDDDDKLCEIVPKSDVSVLRYGREPRKNRHAYLQSSQVIIDFGQKTPQKYSCASFGLSGKHNVENFMAVMLVARILEIPAAVVLATVSGFKGLPHRLEHVSDVNGVSFFNDSKATNVDAAVRAVSGFERPIILIAGGRHKGGDYAPLAAAAEKKVKKAVFLGEAQEKLSAAFKGIIPCEKAATLEEAIAVAFVSATKGDVILLSPACASFDMFSDYTHRGRVFKTTVEGLSHGRS